MPTGWGTWEQWKQPKQPDRKDKAKGKGKNHGQPAGGKPNMPSYDAGSSSSGANSGKDQHSKESLRTILQEIVATNQLEIPEQLKDMMQDDLQSTLQNDQRTINSKRKLAGRLERLRRAQPKKSEQWESFKAEMKTHFNSEYNRFQKESQEIKEAIEETQLSLDKLMKGVVQEETPKESVEDTEFDEWVKDQTRPKSPTTPAMEIDPKTTEMDNALKLTQENQRLLAQQMHDMQAQMCYMVQALRPPMTGPETPTRMPPTSPQTVAPFSRTTRSGPYEKPPDHPEVQVTNLEAMDGATL